MMRSTFRLTSIARTFAVAVGLAKLALFALPQRVVADIDVNSGIDFVTIGAVGNAAWPGDGTVGARAVGRGRVDYEYRIGKFEVTTAQWTEFFNAAFDRPVGEPPMPHLVPPQFWGAVPTTPTNVTNPNARRWRVPAGNEMRLTGDISWRMAAMYCNWLHNDKSTDRAAFMSGAYDVSTFGYTGLNGDIFTDQFARSPGAKYFIPTWDEWMKAGHYDPNKANSDGSTGGWWLYTNGSDVRSPSGLPMSMGGTGGANWGDLPQGPLILLGAYTDVTSPWGLYDMAGGTGEWLEDINQSTDGSRTRFFRGSWWDSVFTGQLNMDSIYTAGADFPSFPTLEHGFRIAALVPCPSTLVFALIWVVPGIAQARRR